MPPDDLPAESFAMLPGGVVRLSRPGDGRVMCCICFEYRQPEDLFADETGQRWDICATGSCTAEAGLEPR